MKEHDAKIDYQPHQLIIYVEKEDNTYGPIITGSYLTKNYFDDFLSKRANLQEVLMKMVKDNEVSPIYYYMTLTELSESELASRVQISKGKVKKHLTAKGFGLAKLEVVERYAQVFNVPVANFFQFIITSGQENLVIEQKNTVNPFVVLTKIEEKK